MPTRLERLLARVADLHGHDLVTAREPEQRPCASRAGHGSRTRRRSSARWRAAPATRASAAARDIPDRPSGSWPSRSASSSPTSPALPCVGGRTRSVAPPKPTSPDAVAADRGRVPDGKGHAQGDVGLAPRRGPEGHRRRHVEHDPGHEHPLREVDADVRLGRPRGDVPVDQPDVVAGDVRAHLRELRPAAEQRRPVVAGEHAVHPPGDGQLERLQQALGHGAGPWAVGCRLRAECLEDADHAAADLPSSRRGCGTAAITASRTSSAERSSASA